MIIKAIKSILIRRFIIITVVISMVFLPEILQGQKAFSPVTAVGVQSGANFNGIRIFPSVDEKQTFGYAGGIYFNYLGERFAGIQIELNYSQKGWKEESDSITSYERTLNYIELPFLSHFVFGQKLRINLNLGPYIGYQISYTENIQMTEGTEGREYYGKDIRNPFNYGFQGGLGFGLKTSAGVFQIEVRYTQAMNNLFDKLEYDYSIPYSLYLGLSYQVEFESKKVILK